MITLNITKINPYQFENNDNSYTNKIEYYIKAYYNYCNCNDFSNLRCPLCKKHTLKYHKTYERYFSYYINEKLFNIKITITVCICEYCKEHNAKQKYHAILPEFIFPYAIYEASTIIKAINDYLQHIKLIDILTRLNIQHKLFYDWLKKFNKYLLSASIVLKVNNIINEVITNIINTSSEFIKQFYDIYEHPFFLFKLTCVQLSIIP